MTVMSVIGIGGGPNPACDSDFSLLPYYHLCVYKVTGVKARRRPRPVGVTEAALEDGKRYG